MRFTITSWLVSGRPRQLWVTKHSMSTCSFRAESDKRRSEVHRQASATPISTNGCGCRPPPSASKRRAQAWHPILHHHRRNVSTANVAVSTPTLTRVVRQNAIGKRLPERLVGKNLNWFRVPLALPLPAPVFSNKFLLFRVKRLAGSTSEKPSHAGC